jgi:hypothetical protein
VGAQGEATAGQRGVPVHAEAPAVDGRLQDDADALRARDVLGHVAEGARGLEGLGVAADGQLARQHELLAVDAQVGGGEAQVWCAL